MLKKGDPQSKTPKRSSFNLHCGFIRGCDLITPAFKPGF